MNCFLRINCVKELALILSNNSIQVCHYAARKGYRDKAKRNKAKAVIKKVAFTPLSLIKAKTKKHVGPKRLPEEIKPVPEDDVWIQKFYRWKMYDFKEAVQNHRETHHPQQYNMPDAPLHTFIELDMRAAKKNKYLHGFTRIAKTPFPFEEGEPRTTLVFCKTPEVQKEADDAGATLVGDVSIIKKMERGDILLPDFQFIIAHPNILPELVSVKGLMKKNFPNIKMGTLGINIGQIVKRFRTGISYTAFQDGSELDYGYIDTCIGSLDMEISQLEENLKCLVEDVMVMKPSRDGPFITKIFLTCFPSHEKMKLDIDPLLEEISKKDGYESDSDDEVTVSK